jgi:hypothetical protein
MTIRAPGFYLHRLFGNCTDNGQNFVTKDRHSDGSITWSVATLFRFYGCKLLILLYLFVPLISVILKESSS